MSDAERDAYVRAALVLQGYAFSEERTVQIVRQFALIDAIAAALVDAELPFDLESASVFLP